MNLLNLMDEIQARLYAKFSLLFMVLLIYVVQKFDEFTNFCVFV